MRLLLDVSAVPARPVGAGVYTVNLARGLANTNDLDLHLLARNDDARRWNEIAPRATVHPEVPLHRPARLAWEQLRAPELGARLGVDVWHGPHYTLPLRVRVPAVVTVLDLTFFDHPEWHERVKVQFFRRMIPAALARANVAVAISQFTAARLDAVLQPEIPVVVAPLGVDTERFGPPIASESSAELARLADIGIKPPYLAFAGTFEPRKDVPSLVAAFAELAPHHPDLRLVLAGRDGWGAVAVRDSVADSGVSTRILRPGWLPAEVLPTMFRHAAAVVYPSLEEGFGLPALEALACGAPLVTTTGSAMEEVVGDAAVLVAPGDLPALVDGIGTVLSDGALAARLRSSGPLRAAGYTWSTAIEQHMEAYRLAAKAAA